MDRFELIKRNTQEIVSEKELKELLKKKKKPRLYIGVVPTSKMHIGYLIPMAKLVDFIDADLDVTIMIADLHAWLDFRKCIPELIEIRSQYYSEMFKAIFKAFGKKAPTIIKGTSFETKADYFVPVLQMASTTTLARTKRAAAEVVRFGKEPLLGGFIYPLMQTQDIIGIKADIAFGGIDQRGIYMLSRDILPEFGHKKPLCIFTPLLPGLTGGKMSASVPESKIDLLDTPKDVKKKIGKAFCPAKEVENNGVLAFLKVVAFPTLERKKNNLVINRPEKFGGNLEFKTYKELETAFKKGLHPMDLKNAMADFLIDLLAPVRKDFDKKKDLLKKAYN
jgi:tyrosyl-tRNA synthetase